MEYNNSHAFEDIGYVYGPLGDSNGSSNGYHASTSLSLNMYFVYCNFFNLII